MTYYPFTKRCPRGHPVDSDEPCGYCAQEDQEREKQDNRLLEQLKRLAASGKLAGLFR